MAGLCTNVRMDVYQRAYQSFAPAPGQYNSVVHAVGRQPVSAKPNAPKYSFGASTRSGARTNDAPAPGAYDPAPSAFGKQRAVSSKPSAAVAVFGTSSRDQRAVRNCAPGPNAYNTGEVYGSGKAVVADSRVTNAPAFSFGTGTRDSESQRPGAGAPGPGNYSYPGALGRQALSSKPTAPGIKFGTSPRAGMARKVASPGPNAYSSGGSIGRQVLSGKPSAPGVRFGTANMRKTAGQRSTTPAPGQYNVSNSMGRPASLSRMPNAPAFKLGTSKRSALARAQVAVPGPNAYSPIASARGDSRKRNTPAFSFGTMKRDNRASQRTGPGPGAYDQATRAGGRAVDSRRKSTPGVKFGMSKRSGPNRATASPGVGQYNAESAVGKQTLSRRPSAPGFSFGTNARFPKPRARAAGGGAARSPQVTKRRPSSARSSSATRRRAPGFKFGTSPRGSRTSTHTPGPQYSTGGGIGRQALSRHRSAGSVKFSTAKRFSATKAVATPAPNAYSSTDRALSRHRSTPAFTMGAR